MAIRGIAKMRGIPEEDLRKERAARVPMGFMGSGWDTAHAALFLASDEARFITGALLPVDGGGSARIGQVAGVLYLRYSLLPLRAEERKLAGLLSTMERRGLYYSIAIGA